MGQLYPNPISTTAGITIIAGNGLQGGGTATLGGSVTLSATGGSGSTRQAYTVTPATDGVVQTFQITNFPITGTPDYLDIYVNGVLQTLGTNYTLLGSSITFSFAPATGDKIDVVTSNPPGLRFQYTLTPAADGVTTSFSFPTDLPDSYYVDVYVNGILQTPTTNYALNLTAGTWAVVFTTAPAAGDVLEVVFDASQFVNRNLYTVTPAPNGIITSFTIVGGVPQNFYIDVFVNGLYQTSGTNYNLNLVSGIWTIVFTTAPLTNDKLEVVF